MGGTKAKGPVQLSRPGVRRWRSRNTRELSADTVRVAEINSTPNVPVAPVNRSHFRLGGEFRCALQVNFDCSVHAGMPVIVYHQIRQKLPPLFSDKLAFLDRYLSW